MKAPDHFWLLKPGSPHDQDDAEPIVEQPFTSIDDARGAARSLGGNLDIFSTPGAGGTWHFVEHVAAPNEK
jgi:hypothetical protein